jgi:hypothetical protein
VCEFVTLEVGVFITFEEICKTPNVHLAPSRSPVRPPRDRLWETGDISHTVVDKLVDHLPSLQLF